MNFEIFTEQVFFATLRVELPNKRSMGTGFLVKVSSVKEGEDYIFLVSNRHVIKDTKEELRIVFHTKNDSKNSPDLKKHHQIAINKIEDGAYYTHPSKDVDLSCLNISEVFNIPGKKFYIRTLSLNQFADFRESDLNAGKEILFVGYPEDRYDHIHNLPILRGGRIASIPQIDFENNPQFLVDAPVYQGSSGSPVFAIIGNTYKLIGVISATMIKGQKLEIVEQIPTAIMPQIIGIGLVYKSTSVKELIEYAKSALDELRK